MMASNPSTKSRILEEARRLANEAGFDRLTTRELAERCSINEGNLYYHFKTKAQIAEALFRAFKHDAQGLFEGALLPGASTSPGEVGELLRRAIDRLRGWCLLSWKYRALMRDGHVLFRLEPALQPAVAELTATLSSRVTLLIDELRRARILSIDEAQLAPLVANIFIVSTYWLGYVVQQTGESNPDESCLDWGFDQIMALIMPYRTWITRLILRRRPELLRLRP